MKEKDFQREFGKWLENSNLDSTNIFELKLSKQKSIRFDAVRDIQKVSLLKAKQEGLYHKINDMPVSFAGDKMRFTNPKPFDCFFIKTEKAYVVVYFYKLRERKGNRKMYWVDINNWLNLQEIYENKKRKSIKEEELSEKADFIYTF